VLGQNLSGNNRLVASVSEMLIHKYLDHAFGQEVEPGAGYDETAQNSTPTSFGYDRNGNLVSESSNGALTTYLWDEENWLSRAQYPDGVEDLCVYFQDGRHYRFTHNWKGKICCWSSSNRSIQGLESLLYRYFWQTA